MDHRILEYQVTLASLSIHISRRVAGIWSIWSIWFIWFVWLRWFLGLVLRMSERLRLETLIGRDGLEQSKQWANKTVGLYLSSLSEPSHYASQPDWKPLFEESIQE